MRHDGRAHSTQIGRLARAVADHVDQGAPGGARDRPAVVQTGIHRLGEHAAPEGHGKAEVDEPRPPDRHLRQPARGIMQPVDYSTRQLVRRFAECPSQDESDVTRQVAERLVARGL